MCRKRLAVLVLFLLVALPTAGQRSDSFFSLTTTKTFLPGEKISVRYRMLSRFDGFMVKWIAGWIGAWLGSPVFGHWGLGFNIQNVYIIPALLGGFALVFLVTAAMKAETVAVAKAAIAPQNAGLAVEMRKAS